MLKKPMQISEKLLIQVPKTFKFQGGRDFSFS